MDWSSVSQFAMTWIINPLLWLFLIGFVLGGVVLYLYIRKKRKLSLPSIEIIELKDGRIAYRNRKCGWFGKEQYFKGLYWRGELQLFNDGMEKIHEFSTEDYTEIDGKRGVVYYRAATDQDILVPISRTELKNKNLVLEIASAQYRDVAADIVRDANIETTDWKDRILQTVTWGLIIVFSMISVILVVQMVKNGQVEAANLVKESGANCLAAAKSVCDSVINSVVAKASVAP